MQFKLTETISIEDFNKLLEEIFNFRPQVSFVTVTIETTIKDAVYDDMFE